MAITGWPVAADYDESIQNPHLNFADPELKGGEVEYDRFGSPAVRSGNFASVYMVKGTSRNAAVRCFLREIADQNERYAAISKDLLSLSLPYTVDFDFVPEGIKVQGTWFPILKMDWCSGELLDEYIERNLLNPVKLRRLSDKWFEMSVALRKEGMAHGDLQHGNVIIQDDEIKLIDYDGMFVPRLAGRKSNERGLEHYQHPGRTDNHFGRYLDNFSHWVIYTTIYSLSVDKSLWRFVNIEDKHLIFSKKDFESPASSPVFEALKRHEDPTIRTYATTVENLLAYDVEKIPDFHPDKPILYPPEKPAVAARGGDRGDMFEQKGGGDRGNLFNGQSGSDRGNLFAEEKGGDRGRLFEDKQDSKNELANVDKASGIMATAKEHPALFGGAVVTVIAAVAFGGWVVSTQLHPAGDAGGGANPAVTQAKNVKSSLTVGYENYGDALKKAEDLVKSIPEADGPARSRALVVKGTSLCIKGIRGGDKSALKDAIQVFKDAHRADENNADAVWGLGKAYQAQGDLASADTQFKRANEMNSELFYPNGKMRDTD